MNIFKRGKQKLKTYKSCDTLYKYNFDKIIDTSDYRWLLHSFNENNDITINKKTTDELKILWLSIFNKYIELKNDTKVIKTLKRRAYISNLENKLFWGATLLKLFVKNPTKENEEALKEWGFKTNEEDNNKKVESIIKQLKSLRTRLNIEVSRYEKLTQKNVKREKTNTQEDVRVIERILELKYPLNTREITVSQWVSYVKDAERVILDKKKQTQNG